MAYKHVIRAKTKNLLNITPSMCKRCTYKDGILKANVVNFYYAVLNVTDLFEIGNTYTVSWSIIHKKSLSQTASVVVYGKSKTDPDKTVFREYRSAITGNNYTFTINDEDFSSISFVELRFFRYNTITTDTESSILNIQVELGSIPTPYTPYNYLQSNKRMIKVSEVCQLLDKSKYDPTHTDAGITWTNNGDGTITANGSVVSSTPYSAYSIYIPQFKEVKNNHKYALFSGIDNINVAYVECIFWLGDSDSYFVQDCVETNRAGTFGFTIPQGEYLLYQKIELRVRPGYTANNLIYKPQLFDLTEMFGAGHEPATVAEFRQRFPNELYPYSPQCWLTSYKSAVVCKTKNLFDVNNAAPYTFANDNPPSNRISLKDGIYTTTYNNYNVGSGLRIKDGLVLSPGTYTLSLSVITVGETTPITGLTYGFKLYKSDGTKPVITTYTEKFNSRCSHTFTIPADCTDIRLYLAPYCNSRQEYVYISLKDIQLEQGSTATSYVPYQHL